MKQFPFRVMAPSLKDSGSVTVTIQIDVPAPSEQAHVLNYIHGTQLKSDFMNGWMRENTPGYGVEVKGGPRPVFETAGDRTSPVISYEQDFRLTRGI
jgi:hypothetical protein